MVKFRRDNVVILGLSEENIQRLKDDKPIKFNMNEMGFPDITVFIITGKTEHSIAADISKMAGGIDPSKTVFKDSSSKEN